ncbi:MAG: hypothetical protein CR988_07800 [Treponema sp.]|nr:MAG: hypothetical protein CR988_07800 [Treponema sp.]
MIFSRFFKDTISGLFVGDAVDGKNAFNNIKVDYVLSRSLYSSAPADGSSYSSYALGNYAPKLYIDTLSSFIDIPEVSATSDIFTKDIQDFIQKNRASFLKLYRQTMIDGKHYVLIRIEENFLSNFEIKIKQIPLELVQEDLCEKTPDGFYSKFVYETVEKWKVGNIEEKATIQFTIEPNKETINITGKEPPAYKGVERESKTVFDFVPVFCIHNNKLVFMKDGIPEIASIVPFIKRYDATLKKLGKHIDNILDPKFKAKVAKPLQFLKYSFGLSDDDISKIERGELKLDITQFKAALLGVNEDINFVIQENNTEAGIKLLQLLHWIIIELTMPEYLYGTAMSTTNASVQEQSPVWVKKVEDRRGEWEEFYYWLVDMFYIAKVAIEGRDIYKIDGGYKSVKIKWKELNSKDDVRLMQALNSLVTSLNQLLELGLIAPQTAFNTIKTFIPINNDFQSEQEASTEWTRFRLELEAIQDRIRSGEADIGDAINELFAKKGELNNAD